MSSRWIAVWLLSAACGGRSTVDSSEQRGLGPANIVPAAAQPLERCADVPVLTLEDLAAGKGAGERIAVDAVPTAQRVCTERDCGDSACCNQCDGQYVIRGPVTADGAPGVEVTLNALLGCSGMDCNLHCEPFGREPTERYRFVGKNTFTPAGATSTRPQVRLAVELYCRL